MANITYLTYSGASAQSLLQSSEFVKQWDELYEACPWATVFQSQRYVDTWYKLYEQYNPVIFVKKADNQIVGLITLAISPAGKLVAAGDGQAEYQGWLARPEYHKIFLVETIQNLLRDYRQHPIHFKYIYHRVPIQELLDDAFLKRHMSVKQHQQPVMKIDETWLNAELRKKNRKEKLNRLKRLGKVTFEKVNNIQDFAGVLDSLIVQCDFRKGAMYGEEFFASDKHKKDFMLQLFSKGLLHVTLLKLDNEIIAANAGIFGRGVVFLQGLNSHSPFHAKYSPGILRFLMLGLQMHQEGLHEFDLTPGGVEGYKTDLATNIYSAHELIIGSVGQVAKSEFILKAKALVKRAFPRGIAGFSKKDDLRKAKREISQKTKAQIKFGLSEYKQKKLWIEEPSHSKMNYSIHRLATEQQAKTLFHKNNLQDLLLFDEKESVISRRQFLSNSMKRLEFGHQVYTLTATNQLIACLWFVPKDSKIEIPKPGKADFEYCFPVIIQNSYPVMLKRFFSDSIVDILSNQTLTESLIFILNSDWLSIEQLIDVNMFRITKQA